MRIDRLYCCHPTFASVPAMLKAFFFSTSLLHGRFWASMHVRGRLFWMQWCVMGCLLRMLSLTSGLCGTSEGNLRRNSSESSVEWYSVFWYGYGLALIIIYSSFCYICSLFYLCVSVKCLQSSHVHYGDVTSPSLLHMYTGRTCPCLCVTFVSRGPMEPRPLQTASHARGCPDNTCSLALVWCHSYGKKYVYFFPHVENKQYNYSILSQ